MFAADRATKWLAAAAAALALAGGSFGILSVTTGSSSGAATAAGTGTAVSSASAGRFPSGGGGANARSGPAAGGASGKVTAMSKSGFTLTTSAGQKVTVKETSSTVYRKGTASSSAGAVKTAERVLVLGTVNGKTITASQVILQPKGSGSAPSWAGKVIPFERGAPSAAKSVGQVPASYKQGSGTIVSGPAASKATRAALAVYPGGIVDRVVRLSNGEYEVHDIGVNWPHHIFVNTAFKVVGAG